MVRNIIQSLTSLASSKARRDDIVESWIFGRAKKRGRWKGGRGEPTADVVRLWAR